MIPIAWQECFSVDLPIGHRFPMEKYALLHRFLVESGICCEDQFFAPLELAEETILAVHEEDYYRRFIAGDIAERSVRKVGFPLTREIIERELAVCAGTYDAAFKALHSGIAFSIAGGTHHAFAAAGEAYCWLNDVAIAAKALLARGAVERIAVVDLDVHQGNGTAAIFSDCASVYTLSIHAGRCYPTQKKVSDLDVSLDNATGDRDYLRQLDMALEKLERDFSPDFIFYVAGVDVLQGDRFGKLELSLEACQRRDEKVIDFCQNKAIPLCVTMGGGYQETTAATVAAHANTFKVAMQRSCGNSSVLESY